jgi:hypothetical protein
MEMILILTILGVLFWVVKITFFTSPATEKPAKVKRVPVVDTFAEPIPDVPGGGKIKWDKSKSPPPLTDTAAMGAGLESFGHGNGMTSLFYDED